MAILADKLGYLIDPAFQIESVAGKPLVGGHIEVFLAGTNTKYITCYDWDGANNPFKIPLKNDGRSVILAEVGQHYDFYVFDSYGNLAFSRLNVMPGIGGNVNLNGKKYITITNDDGTLDISVNAASQSYDKYTIDSNHTPLGVESPLYFKEDTEDSVIIGLDESVIDEKVREAAKGFATQDDINRAVAAEAQIRSTNDNAIGTKADQAKSKADAVDTYVKQHEAEWSKDTTYTAGDHIGITNNVISVTGDVGKTYTAGANININAQNVISGKDWTSEIAAVESVADSKQDKLTAGSNIKIENNTISVTGEMGKIYTGVGSINVDNTKNEISIDDSGYATLEDMPNVFIGEYGVTTFAEITQALADKKAIFIINCPMNQGSGKRQAHYAGTKTDGSIYYFENTEITYQTNDPRIIRYTLTTSNSWGNVIIVSKVAAESYVNSAVSGKQDKLTAGTNIGINGNVISVTGELGKTYTGENYVNVNNDTNKIGLTDTAKSKLDSFVGEFDLSAGNNITFRQSGNTVFIDGQQGGSTYTAGANINITNNVISGKSWTTEIAAKQDKLTDYNPTLWNTVSNKQDALDWTPTIEDI